MKYVEIRFSKNRKVFIDNKENGETNKILRIGAGTHAFHLGEPKDYRPYEIICTIQSTTALKPEIIKFEEL
jgi:hypothetical protein